jgi:SulP family sulfate permease
MGKVKGKGQRAKVRSRTIENNLSSLLHKRSNRSEFLPASILALRDYSFRTFTSDLIAGVTVGLVALPLAMAFAISSGMTPQAGIYCAIVTGFLISALGGSYVQIGGPTGAFVVVVSGIIAEHGLDGLFMCTMMAGVVLVVMGLTGSGTAVRFIPRPVVIGFTNGIALVIASTQLRDVFGIRLDGPVPGEFIDRMRVLLENIGNASMPTAVVGIGVLVLIVVWNRLVPRVPGYIVALVAGTLIVAVAQLPLETIGTRFGGIPAGLPELHVPRFRPDLILSLLSPTLTVAMLGAIESLLSAVVADRMSARRHNSNVELFAQGVANIVSPMVGGLPATGAIARTATNVRAGGRTPVSGIIHALTLLAILLFASRLAALVPMAVLGSILLVVAYNMGEWREIPELWKHGWTDRIVWMWTFGLTVLADLTVAVEAGMIIAALMFIRRVTATTTVSRVTLDYVKRGRAHILQDKDIPAYVTILRIHGPFLFGATDKLVAQTAHIDEFAPIVVLRLRNMTALDGTGLRAIQDFADALSEKGRTLLLCGALPQPASLMNEAEFHRHVGEENILPHVEAALRRAAEIWAGAGPLQPSQHPPAA